MLAQPLYTNTWRRGGPDRRYVRWPPVIVVTAVITVAALTYTVSLAFDEQLLLLEQGAFGAW